METVELSEEEKDYLDDILTIWIDGYEEAQQEVLRDPLVKSFDDLTSSSGNLKEQELLAIQIREKIRE